MSVQKTIFPANTQIQINPDDSGTNIQSFLQKDNLRIVRQDPTNTVGNNLTLSVDSSEPNLILSKGSVDGITQLTETLLQSSASYINSVNNDNADVQLYSTSGTTKTLNIQNPPVPYVRGCSVASNAFTIGGHYAEYTDGVANIKRVYTGFYRDATPSLGAVQATTQNGLLDPNATKVDIAVRSNLDLQSTQEIKNASNIKTTTITDKNTSTGNQGQILSSTSSGIDWITPTPIVSTLEYYITATSPFFQVPPVAPTQALITSYQYYGWYFQNDVALKKIDWFFAPDYAMTVADVKGMYLNYFNITATSNDDLPFLTIYTKPTGTNDYYPSFAHSSATYIANFTPTVAIPYSSFMNISGVQPDPFPYGHQLGAMILSPVAPNPRGEYLGTEEVLAISIGTNSISAVGQCNFIFQKLGICLEQGNAELVLNPQNILDPTVNTLTATTSVKPTTILDLNNSAGTSSQVLSSTGTGIDWVDNPTPYVNTSGQVAGNLLLQGNDITGVDAIDGNSGGLSIGRGAGTTSNISIGKAGVAIDLNNTVRLGADGAVSAGTDGDVATSGGVGQPTRWAYIALKTITPAQTIANSALNVGNSILTNTITNIIGKAGDKYLFIFFITLESAGSPTGGNVVFTLTTTPADSPPSFTTPIATNSSNVNTGILISTASPNKNNCLCCNNHTVNVQKLYTLNFSHIYTFPADQYTSFAVWCNNGAGSGAVVRLNYQMSSIRLA